MELKIMGENRMSYLGENIRKLRKTRGLTVKELAKKSNSSVSSISQIETGKRDATFKLILNIAQALEIEITELVTPPKEKHFKHNLDIVLHVEKQTIIFGNSYTNESDVISWGGLVNLSKEELINKIHFVSNNNSIGEDAFFTNILVPYLIHQRLRILLRTDIDFKVTIEDINLNRNSWNDIKSLIIHYQNLISTKYLI